MEDLIPEQVDLPATTTITQEKKNKPVLDKIKSIEEIS